MTRRPPLTLRKRIMLSFILLAALVTLLFSAIIHVGSDMIEHYIFSESLEAEAEWISASLTKGALPALPADRQLYDAMTVPDDYRNLSPGYHEIEKSNSEEWHLLVFEYDDRRYYLLQNGDQFEKLEGYIDLLLLLALLISLAAAIWIGQLTSTRILVPITQLAEAANNNITPFPHQRAGDEIGILARSFAKHSEELQQYLQREQNFVGDVSHELRTPLAIILGAAEVIERQTRHLDTAHPSALRIYRIAQEMNAQLTAMLLLSRAPETLDAPPADLLPIIDASIARCQPLLEGKSIRIMFDDRPPVIVAGRPELIESVIHNLLRNACQYTEHGDIRIELTPQALTITDSGPGLPSSIDPERFRRFVRGAPAAAGGNIPPGKTSGEGLGLSIAQRVALHLGWRMTVDTGPRGTCFRLAFGNASDSPQRDNATPLETSTRLS